MKVKSESEVAQSCLTLHDPMDCSLPSSSAHGIFQARVLEWSAIAFSKIPLGSSIKVKSRLIGKDSDAGRDLGQEKKGMREDEMAGWHHGEGNGNPLQYSCLENPRDGGAWWDAVYGVAQSRTRLK